MATQGRFNLSPHTSKRCSRCGERKPESHFAWHRKHRERESYCRPCRSLYKKEHYARNKQRYKDQAVAWKEKVRKERTEYLIAYFESHPCVDCGESDFRVLEFDHLEDKSFEVMAGWLNKSWDAVLAEIEKCEVVCGNCHRRRTARRGGFLRARVVDRLQKANDD